MKKMYELGGRFAMDGNPLISVIVPVYKVEKYLRRCVDSIRNQTYNNLEILLVDDGSPDSCGSICDEYSKCDKRIKVIHKENGGLSDARNAGLDVMEGEYVTCIDSDDFVSKYYVMNLYNAIKESHCDISASWFIDYYEGDPIPKAGPINKLEIEVMTRVEAYKRMLYQDGFEISAWGKLYRSSLFNGIRYPFGKLYEDIPTTYRLMEQTDKIAVIPQIDYYYFQRKESIAQSGFNVKKMDGINHMNDLRQFITENYPQLRKAAECRYFSTVCNILFLMQPGDEYKKEQKQLWFEIKKYRKSVLLNGDGRKKARIGAAISFLGYQAMRKIYLKSQRK